MDALDKKNPEAIENLMDEQIFTKIEFQTEIKDTAGRVIFFFLAGVVLVVASLVSYYSIPRFEEMPAVRLALYASFYVGWVVAACLIAESFIKLVRLRFFNFFYKSKFIIFLFKKRNLKIRIILSFIMFSTLNFFFHRFFGLKSIEKKYAALNKVLTRLSTVFGLLLFCMLISGSIVDYLDYYSYQLNYKSRVKNNKVVLRYIQKINRALPQEITDLRKYAVKLFDAIVMMARSYNFDSNDENNVYNEVQPTQPETPQAKKNVQHEDEEEEDELGGDKSLTDEASAEKTDENTESVKTTKATKSVKSRRSVRQKEKKKGKNKEYLTVQDFDRLFSEPEMFGLFDFDRNNKVTRHEFVKRYIALFEERERLKRALEQNSNNMMKINILISSLFVPFVVFIVLAFTGQLPSFQDSFTMAGLVIFPFTFAFKSLMEEIFSSVIFVFFIKPFDYGDIFFVENNKYEVLSIGILYSDFLLNDKFITLKNNTFNTAQIFNLRKSDFITSTYTFKFDYKSFKENEDDFVDGLEDYFSETPSNSYKIGNFQVEKNVITVTLEVKNIVPYQEIDMIEERNDSFVLFVNNLIEEVNIVQL